VSESHPSTHKKVVVRKLDKELVKGFVKPNEFLAAESIELLDLDGHLVSLSLAQIKGVYFVREFDGAPERQERKVFKSRPRVTGLWVRMKFKDAEVLDGLIPENLLELDSRGYTVTPPDVNSNNLKIFVPRSALASMEVLGVIANGARRSAPALSSKASRPQPESRQIGLF
jgi:uncharacterized protein DUF6982